MRSWIIIALAGTLMSGNARAVTEHPFLICTRSQFPELRARASAEPWLSMKNDVLAEADSTLTFDDPKWVHSYISACALTYILGDGDPAAYAERTRTAIMLLDSVVFDPSLDWKGTVAPMAVAFVAILALDIVYDDLDSADIAACENLIKTKIDLIPKTGSWPAGRMGTHGTWDIYKGIRTGPDNEYYNNYVGQMTVDGMSTVAPNYAFARLGSDNKRPQKSGYADVLEFTGIDNRYYDNPLLKKYYQWLFGFSLTPNREYYMFGDVGPGWGPGNHIEFWRVGNFDETAAGYAAWMLEGERPHGHLLSYILMKEPLPEPIEPDSRLFMDGGAVFRETSGTASLGCLLYNISKNDEWHTHEETNGISCAAYGTRLLVNGGWLGSSCWPSYRNNTVAINGARHARKRGGGLEEGFLGGPVDYACGTSGSALGDDSFKRSMVLVRGRDGAHGYFLVADDIDADSGETAHAYLQVQTESAIEETEANTEYRATIDHHASVDGVGLAVFYATRPRSVGRDLTPSGDLNSDPAAGKHYRLEARFDTDGAGNVRTLTALFPYDADHTRAAMARRSGTGFTGMSLAQAGGVTDYAYVSDGAADCSDNGIAFRAEVALFRDVDGMPGFYFARNGRSLRNGAYGFESSAPVSVQMADTAGTVTGGGGMVTFYYPEINAVLLDGFVVPADGAGSGWCRVPVPAGTFGITLLAGGAQPPADTVPPAIEEVRTGAAPDTVRVLFSEPVAQAGAETAGNYVIPGLTVNSAVLESGGYTVRLSVSTMTLGTDYTLYVSNVTDRADSANAIPANTAHAFGYHRCTSSEADWQCTAVTLPGGKFQATYTVTPRTVPCNALFALSEQPVTGYADCAVLVRLNKDGMIDARNSGTYEAATALSYAADTVYAFTVTVDPAAHTYDVSVTPGSGASLQIAAGFAYRTEQAAADNLAYWNVIDDLGTHDVCSVRFEAVSGMRDGHGTAPAMRNTGRLYSLGGKPADRGRTEPGVYVAVGRNGTLKKKVVIE